MYSAFDLSDEYPKLHYWVTTFFLCPFNLGSYSSLYPPPSPPPPPPKKKKNNGKRCKEHPVRSVPFHLHWGWFPCFLLIIGKILRVSALASREAGAVTAKPFIGNKISFVLTLKLKPERSDAKIYATTLRAEHAQKWSKTRFWCGFLC